MDRPDAGEQKPYYFSVSRFSEKTGTSLHVFIIYAPVYLTVGISWKKTPEFCMYRIENLTT